MTWGHGGSGRETRRYSYFFDHTAGLMSGLQEARLEIELVWPENHSFFLLNNRLISSPAGRCAPAQVAEVVAAGFSWQICPQF